jgi:hypothetical protein
MLNTVRPWPVVLRFATASYFKKTAEPPRTPPFPARSLSMKGKVVHMETKFSKMANVRIYSEKPSDNVRMLAQ